jgi:hypothetical protein
VSSMLEPPCVRLNLLFKHHVSRQSGISGELEGGPGAAYSLAGTLIHGQCARLAPIVAAMLAARLHAANHGIRGFRPLASSITMKAAWIRLSNVSGGSSRSDRSRGPK